MLSFLPPTPSQISDSLKVKFKQKRKILGYTQVELSSRSGVSLGSLKRFEQSGQISLESLLKLAVILGCLEEFNSLCDKKEDDFKSIEEIIDDK